MVELHTCDLRAAASAPHGMPELMGDQWLVLVAYVQSNADYHINHTSKDISDMGATTVAERQCVTCCWILANSYYFDGLLVE